MITISPFIVAVGISVILFLSRRGGMGALGVKIRNSDHWALEDAIAEKKQELAELEALRPKYKLE